MKENGSRKGVKRNWGIFLFGTAATWDETRNMKGKSIKHPQHARGGTQCIVQGGGSESKRQDQRSFSYAQQRGKHQKRKELKTEPTVVRERRKWLNAMQKTGPNTRIAAKKKCTQENQG